MPKRKTGVEQTDEDVRVMWDKLAKDYPSWQVDITMTYNGGRWIQIVATALDSTEGAAIAYVTARVYCTPRTPSFVTSVWKALFGLYMQIGRHKDGLPPLLGY